MWKICAKYRDEYGMEIETCGQEFLGENFREEYESEEEASHHAAILQHELKDYPELAALGTTYHAFEDLP